MNTHKIQLNSYCAAGPGGPIYLGTAGSHGNEQLKIIRGDGWETLAIQVVFCPCKVAVQLPADGLLDVPWEATAIPLTTQEGRIVFQGFDQDRLVNSTDLHYTVSEHSIAIGRDEEPYTPGIVEGVLNRMASDKTEILAAADEARQAKEDANSSAGAAQISANQATIQATAAQQNADNAQTAQMKASSYAAAASKTLSQVETVTQQAVQKINDAEDAALKGIAAVAPIIPAISAVAARQAIVVKPGGTGYNLVDLAPLSAGICPIVTGNPIICKHSAAWGLQRLKIYGKSTQNGKPSLEKPIPIESAGDNGSIKITITGKNLFDASKIESGFAISEDGSIVPDNLWFITDFIRIGSCKTYSFSGILTTYNTDMMTVRIYDSRKEFLDFVTITVDKAAGKQSGSFQSLKSAAFVQFCAKISEKDKIIFNEGSVIQFEPYTSQTLTFSTPNSLSGIPVKSGGNYTDANGQQWICDVKNYFTGKYITNIKRVIIDEETTITMASSADWPCNRFVVQLPEVQNNLYPDQILCNMAFGGYKMLNSARVADSSVYFFFDFANVDMLKAKLSETPLELYYILQNPTESDIPDEEMAAYRAVTSYNDTTVVSTTENVAGLEVQYTADGTNYLQSVTDRILALEAAQSGE